MYEFLFGVLVGLVVGVGGGLMGYRYALKRDPEKLEAWAQKLKRLRAAKVNDAIRKEAGK